MPGNLREPEEETAEAPVAPVRTFAPPGVDVLAEQRHLADTVGREPARLGDDRPDRPRHLGATGIGHDTEGAELVAAFLHRHERSMASGDAPRALCPRPAHEPVEYAELLRDRELGGDDPPARVGLSDEVGQPLVRLRPDHKVDRRRAPHDLIAFGLGDAAGDPDRHRTALRRGPCLDAAQPADLGIDLLGRLLADMAGVQEDQVGGFGRIDRRIAGLGQRVRHPFGIVDVHLAAISADVNFALRWGRGHEARLATSWPALPT